MTALAELLSDRDRQRLAGWLAELRATDRLMREISAQRPPEAPPTLAQLSTATTTDGGPAASYPLPQVRPEVRPQAKSERVCPACKPDWQKAARTKTVEML